MPQVASALIGMLIAVARLCAWHTFGSASHTGDCILAGSDDGHLSAVHLASASSRRLLTDHKIVTLPCPVGEHIRTLLHACGRAGGQVSARTCGISAAACTNAGTIQSLECSPYSDSTYLLSASGGSIYIFRHTKLPPLPLVLQHTASGRSERFHSEGSVGSSRGFGHTARHASERRAPTRRELSGLARVCRFGMDEAVTASAARRSARPSHRSSRTSHCRVLRKSPRLHRPCPQRLRQPAEIFRRTI
jgi:hypothetical protein